MSKTSVIVPVYNVESYIRRCIDSILNQTFKDFELILIDDGSPDNCPAICDEYAKLDGRIRVIHKNNEGVSKARNDGVRCSNGKYITFVDSDDWLENEYLSILYDNLVKYDADISVVMISHPEKIAKDTNQIKLLNKRDAINYFGNLNDARLRAPMGKLIKREIVLNNPFPTDRTYAEDMAVIYKWYNDSEIIVSIDARPYNYFLNSNGSTLKPYCKHHLGNLKTLNEILLFFKENQYNDLYIKFFAEYFEALIKHHNSMLVLNERKIARKINTEIHSILLKNPCFCINNFPHYCNTVFPKSMSLYWFYKSILQKFKSIFGVKNAND